MAELVSKAREALEAARAGKSECRCAVTRELSKLLSALDRSERAYGDEYLAAVRDIDAARVAGAQAIIDAGRASRFEAAEDDLGYTGAPGHP